MFEKVSRAAERAATSASRREFLGRVGRGALGLAAALGGLLALPDVAAAGTIRCGPGSVAPCRGKLVGALCFRRSYYCMGPPNCKCRRGP